MSEGVHLTLKESCLIVYRTGFLEEGLKSEPSSSWFCQPVVSDDMKKNVSGLRDMVTFFFLIHTKAEAQRRDSVPTDVNDVEM